MASTTEQDLKVLKDHDLRGFAYFDSTETLRQWKETDVDPLHKSNTPLLVRPEIPESLQMHRSSNIMIMHDYKNGYVEDMNQAAYESCQGAFVESNEYVLEYWQRVEIFNYFNHRRVAVPPATWINTAHRNGVLVLGTFCIEGDSEELRKEAAGIIENEDGKYWLADVLTRMAVCYGFDGWLINIEINLDVSEETWDGGAPMRGFLHQLKEGLKRLPSGGKLVWYDALTKKNAIQYQNTLNAKNVDFAEAAGSISTNYFWKQGDETDPALAVDVAKGKVQLNDLYYGLDCWAQNNDGPSRSTRRTFGFDRSDEGIIGSAWVGAGHGGTATGWAMHPMALKGLGTGLFAPGWAYEHFNEGKYIDRFMWDGSFEEKPLGPTLLKSLDCKCHSDRDNKQHIGLERHMDPRIKDILVKNPISKYARKYAAGSEAFFHTDYASAYSSVKGSGTSRVHMGQQSILPSPGERTITFPVSPGANGIITADPLPFEGNVTPVKPSRLMISITMPQNAQPPRGSMVSAKVVLHKVNISGALNPDIYIRYQKLGDYPGLKLHFFIEVGNRVYEQELLTPAWSVGKEIVPIRNTGDHITAIGISIAGPNKSFSHPSSLITSIMDIYNITIKPHGHVYNQSAICNVRVQHRCGDKPTAHRRLVWDLEGVSISSEYLPFSSITGPYSHFVVQADEKVVGRAYACEFILEGTIGREGASTVLVNVLGFGFDGTLLANWAGEVALV